MTTSLMTRLERLERAYAAQESMASLPVLVLEFEGEPEATFVVDPTRPRALPFVPATDVEARVLAAPGFLSQTT